VYIRCSIQNCAPDSYHLIELAGTTAAEIVAALLASLHKLVMGKSQIKSNHYVNQMTTVPDNMNDGKSFHG